MLYGWLGEILHTVLIGEKLRQIFATRCDYLQGKWGMEKV